MSAPTAEDIRAAIGEDLCHCGHVCSAHADAVGICSECHIQGPWGEYMRCHLFRWNGTWRPPASART